MVMRLEKGAHHATKRRKHGHGLFAQQRNKFKTGQSLTGNEIEMLSFSFLWGKGGQTQSCCSNTPNICGKGERVKSKVQGGI